jgi:hypothetical protein
MAEQTAEATISAETSKLAVVTLGLAFGIIWAIGAFMLGLMAMGGWGVAIVEVLSSAYIGYAPTLVGSIAGGVWGFFDGFIFAVLVAWLYNRLLPVCRCR